MNTYPEHEKLEKISEKSQACGEFLHWLMDQGYVLATRHEHSDLCDPYTNEYGAAYDCGMGNGQLISVHANIQSLLAEFFDIDQTELEREKRVMLDRLRKVNSK